MKLALILLTFISSVCFVKEKSLASLTPPIYTCDSIPQLNRQIIAFVKGNLNKKVGRGECWDLAAQALNKVGATWDKNYAFGKVINEKKDCVYPGDIMQFEGVEIEYEKNKVFYKENLEHHTAIIYQVKGKETFVMAEQNTSTLGKKVGLSSLDLKNIRKGNFRIFRPYK